jgi:hypothetical protein
MIMSDSGEVNFALRRLAVRKIMMRPQNYASGSATPAGSGISKTLSVIDTSM